MNSNYFKEALFHGPQDKTTSAQDSLPNATSLSRVLEHPSVNRQDHYDKILALRGQKSFQAPEGKKNHKTQEILLDKKKMSQTELTCFEQSMNSAVILPHSC